MPNDKQGFDIETLKRDPTMWRRLAMPSKYGDNLEDVFKDKENPFEKNNIAAMEMIKKLAAEGNLYLREHGRSRHFHKVEKDGEKLKLGEQHEMKLSNRNIGLGLAGLMWLSRGYFKWIGLERISNWFDKRLKQRSEISELNRRYKEEYKSLSKEEKKELKALRKHEKNLKKLAKAQMKAEKTQRELDKLRGKDTSGPKSETDSPLSNPPDIEPEKNSMQPTLMGDELNKTVQQTKQNNFVQTQSTQVEISGTKKEESQEKENKNQLIINGVEVTKENVNDFPPHIVEAFKVIQQLIIENETKEKVNQQPVQEQPPEVKENVQQTVPETHQVENENKQEEIPVVEEIKQQENAQPKIDTEVVNAEMTAPLNDPPKVEEDKVNIQGRPKEQEQPTLRERLAAEKEAMDSVLNLNDHLTNVLFSHEATEATMNYRQMIADSNDEAGVEYMLGAIFGVLSKVSQNPEQKQQVMDALLNGKPLGSENENLISDGISAYSDAISRNTNSNPLRMADMLANSMRELSYQASRETTLSPKLVMIGALIGKAAKMANENNLELPLDEDEMDVIRGATVLADVAKKYHKARQFLGEHAMDNEVKNGRWAVRDLLMGNAVEKMIQQDKRLGQTITNTQQIMGEGLWSIDNLRVYTSASATRRGIQQADIKKLLEKPNSIKALDIGISTVNEIVKASQEDYEAGKKAWENEMGMEQQQEQPEINPMNVGG